MPETPVVEDMCIYGPSFLIFYEIMGRREFDFNAAESPRRNNFSNLGL
jgi:hypothetical protein